MLMAFLCLFDCRYGRRDQQSDPAPSVVLLPPYPQGPAPLHTTRRNFKRAWKIIMLAYVFMMKAAGIPGDPAAAFMLSKC